MRKWQPKKTAKRITLTDQARAWASASETERMRMFMGVPRPVQSLTRTAMRTVRKHGAGRTSNTSSSETAALRTQVADLRRRVIRVERQMAAFAEVVVSGVGVIVAVMNEMNRVTRPVGPRSLEGRTQRRITSAPAATPKPPVRKYIASPPRGWNDFSDVVDLRVLFEPASISGNSMGSGTASMRQQPSAGGSSRPASASKQARNARKA
ncbi:hypothetical protein HDU93_005093 [Gonapodya sp. JEL0774]|nr:hypothetical protein HDU93_005093 [Gonapodya sp. JEL0774]